MSSSFLCGQKYRFLHTRRQVSADRDGGSTSGASAGTSGSPARVPAIYSACAAPANCCAAMPVHQEFYQQLAPEGPRCLQGWADGRVAEIRGERRSGDPDFVPPSALVEILTPAVKIRSPPVTYGTVTPLWNLPWTPNLLVFKERTPKTPKTGAVHRRKQGKRLRSSSPEGRWIGRGRVKVDPWAWIDARCTDFVAR
ncbi:hypothetical protein B296_00049063 [Ensete ventricosum]|uniref:Uncharacterized protein n=1 Tax=Ensete ventricosum TaxID=4639 RepID=A0A426YS82_ENSVE|nr:hypothetical protein B296_00049063 [Ensete ventricosum]